MYLWPCNVAAWQAFLAVQTQWRVGFNGRSGLDYAGVRTDLAERGIGAKDRRELWPGIKACEYSALRVWAEQRAELEEQRRSESQRQPGWS